METATKQNLFGGNFNAERNFGSEYVKISLMIVIASALYFGSRSLAPYSSWDAGINFFLSIMATHFISETGLFVKFYAFITKGFR